MMNLLRIFLLLVIASGGATAVAADLSLVPPDDPRQSITYWKAYSIDAHSDPMVAVANNIFSTLLRGWDSSRLEPGLYVVDSSAGPWAASLADGNILLSREAISRCMAYGRQRGDHLLAFVLAHELAHQRADDLWHQRFFRMIGKHNAETRSKMMRGLQLDQQLLSDMQQKEAQADHDGLILMSSVGYDPYQILDRKDFFTAWVESIWGDSCRQVQADSAMRDACRQAQARALRTRAQLSSVASQSMLYELGVQSFVAGQYARARDYFTAYARDYPSRAVMSALGLTYLAEALRLHDELQQQGLLRQPAFYFPLMLDASARAQARDPSSAPQQKRSAVLDEQRRQAMHLAVEQSIQHFEKAIRLEPAHKKTYLLLATAYLLDANSYMVRGVLQGRYLPSFGNDPAVDMLLAMTSAIEGKTSQAQQAFEHLLQQLPKQAGQSAMPQNLLVYAATYNSAALALFDDQPALAQQYWQQLAAAAKSSGNALVFRLALGHLVPASPGAHLALSRAPSIDGIRLGDRAAKNAAAQVSDLWIDGEQHRVYRLADGARYIVDPTGRVISAWQQQGKASLQQVIRTGDDADRAFKALGLPDRRLDMVSGEYLAYDQYGLALHINNNQVLGWFLYTQP